MTVEKRLFDLGLALLLLPFLAVAMVVVCALVALIEGRPILHRSERMKAPGEGFTLWKFRTMQVVEGDGGISGGHKAARVTRTGRFLRRTRLDELPQIWNILRGDLSFVGPRPPLREYVERYPQVYDRVLRTRPGVTGLASLRYHQHEERLLGHCATPEEADRIYCRRCIPAKARLDLFYQRHASVWFDLTLIGQTALRVIR